MGLQLHAVLTAFVHLPHTFGLQFRSHDSRAILALDSHIRLMVDVLLTMNEAFRLAEGRVFLFLRHKRSVQGISEKKHD